MKKQKKILVFSAIGLLSMILSAGCIGWINQSQTLSYELKVNKPVYVSFQIFNDPLSIPKWVSGFQDIKIISGNLDKPGSEYLLFLNQFGEDIQVSGVLKSFIDNKEYSCKYETKYSIGIFEAKFIGVNNNSKLRFSNTYTAKNIFYSILLYAMKENIDQQQQQQFEKLKEVIESATWG